MQNSDRRENVVRVISKKKRGLALAAAFVLLALTARADVTYGAGGIETDRKDCKVTFDLSTGYMGTADPGDGGPDTEEGTWVTGDRFADLNNSLIQVELYRVASVDVSGRYTALAPYEELSKSLASLNDTTTAQEWGTLAEKAYVLTVPETGEGGGAPVVSPADSASFRPADGDAVAKTISGLQTGLYLAAAEDVVTEEYIYHFTPYLISLPGNSYAPPEDEDDTWEYDVTVGLKPGQEDRMGDLEIVKTLRSYNETLGGASFLFEIRAEKNGLLVYSDVCSLAFDGPGTRSVKIEGKIPVKADVTVTEVYSGSSYQVTEGTAEEQHPVIEAEKTAVAEFSNEYDDRLNGGTSIVNTFFTWTEEDEALWDCRQYKDSTERAGGN